jgi:hypothetical protein
MDILPLFLIFEEKYSICYVPMFMYLICYIPIYIFLIFDRYLPFGWDRSTSNLLIVSIFNHDSIAFMAIIAYVFFLSSVKYGKLHSWDPHLVIIHLLFFFHFVEFRFLVFCGGVGICIHGLFCPIGFLSMSAFGVNVMFAS